MSSEVDPMQITVAVFDRFVYKFKEVLEVRELDPSLIRDALKTLNELVHHQVKGHTQLIITYRKRPTK